MGSGRRRNGQGMAAQGGAGALALPLALALAVALACALVGPAVAQTSSGVADQPQIVGPLPNTAPGYSPQREPDARALIETWIGGYTWPAGKRFDQERYAILDRRVAWSKFGNAYLHFRILPAVGEDALVYARDRCPSARAPIEVQVHFEWSEDLGAWVPMQHRGDPGFEACAPDFKPWTPAQVDKIVSPPPLPQPPVITSAQVTTPAAGSVDRKAILQAIRPRYQAMFGAPIRFRVEAMRMGGGFAFVVVHPQRANGAPIDEAAWKKKIDECLQSRETLLHEYWMKKVAGVWTVAWRNDFCADDSIADFGDIVGAPPQLVEREAWPERDSMPVNDPQYIDKP